MPSFGPISGAPVGAESAGSVALVAQGSTAGSVGSSPAVTFTPATGAPAVNLAIASATAGSLAPSVAVTKPGAAVDLAVADGVAGSLAPSIRATVPGEQGRLDVVPVNRMLRIAAQNRIARF